MKLVRFLYKRDEFWGKLDYDHIRIIDGNPYRKIKLTTKTIPLNNVALLAPATPTKIILVGLNYRDHARELKMKIPKEPVIFLKPPSSVVAPGASIIYPKQTKRLDYEAELAVVIKKRAKSITPGDAPKHILGYTCLNDVTARDLQVRDGQWIRAKSFDTFCPLGPHVETTFNSRGAKIQLYLNGRLKQDSSISRFIFAVNYLVSFISRVMTITPGDIISTGTPAGVGPMKPGDRVEVRIEGIGSLVNLVKR